MALLKGTPHFKREVQGIGANPITWGLETINYESETRRVEAWFGNPPHEHA